jgi:asparagine synthase (glutamine-hydrolysing)
MCGIFLLKIGASYQENLIQIANKQIQLLAHRGPNDQGFLIYDYDGNILATEKQQLFKNSKKPNLLIGHTRLSVIDVSSAGHQPMLSKDGRFSLVFNGEIYNYLEIRKLLQENGYLFHTQTDTEVLLASLIIWGHKALKILEGMFSFVLFDSLKKNLLCARDIFGIKPLYWTKPTYDSFAISSELRAILEISNQSRYINIDSAYNYLSSGITDTGNSCLISNIHQLPPGHKILIDDNNQINGPEPFFSFSLSDPIKISFPEAAEETRRLFLKSVALHLRSDVPLGVALSGGIDSSSVACAVNHLQPNTKLKTFSFIAHGYKISEEKWIDIITDSLYSDSYKVFIKPNELFNDLSTLINRLGEPFGSTSIYAQYRVFKLAHEHGITVTLEGQGADEMLAGYLGYTHLRFLSLIRKRNLIKAFKVLKKSTSWPNRSLIGTLKRIGNYILPKKLIKYGRAINEGSFSRDWLNKNTIKQLCLSDWSLISPNIKDSIDKLRFGLANQLTWSGLPALLRHSDRNSMTFSIESRVPFCNRELATFLLSLPEEYLVTDEGLTKAIFRNAMRGLVPEPVLNRTDKIGFETPEKEWFLNNSNLVEKFIFDSSNSILIDKNGLYNNWSKIKKGQKKFDWFIWRCINYLHWKDLFNVLEK